MNKPPNSDIFGKTKFPQIDTRRQIVLDLTIRQNGTRMQAGIEATAKDWDTPESRSALRSVLLERFTVMLDKLKL